MLSVLVFLCFVPIGAAVLRPEPLEAAPDGINKDIPTTLPPPPPLDTTNNQRFAVIFPGQNLSGYISNVAPSTNILPTILPSLKQFTLVAWIKDETPDDTTYMSYITQDNKAALYIQSYHQHDHYKITILNQHVKCQKPFHILEDWHHIALSWVSYGGAVAIYLDGKILNCDRADFNNGSTIPTGYGHRMQLGTGQDTAAGDTFSGEMAYVNMFSWVMFDEEVIQRMMEGPTESTGDILAWDQDKLALNGGVTVREG